MLETLWAQLRTAASVALGVRLSTKSLDRVIDAIEQTRREFGSVGSDAAEMIGGPALDPATLAELQRRRFCTQAARAASQTVYYRELFASLRLSPAKLSADEIRQIPLTRKDAVRDRPDDFVCRDAQPCFQATTSGTTGRPTIISFSRHEMTAYMLLAAASFLQTNFIGPEDIIQINNGSRAFLGNSCFAGAAARIGALVCPIGQVEPSQTLALLAQKRNVPGKKDRVSVLAAYPSYLGQLVEQGPALGYEAKDFGLQRIMTGGETVTDGLRRRLREFFGDIHIGESYGMTETWPLCGQRCSQGHLHFEPIQALVEVLDPQTGEPAAPGAFGTLVATPLPPYRETTIVLRYDTADVVRVLEGPLTCEMKRIPATSDLLGKQRLAVQHENGWTFPRDIMEALESVAAIPLPARFSFGAEGDGVFVEVVARNTASATRQAIADALESRGVPLRRLELVDDPRQLNNAFPLRCDLRELGFSEPTRQMLAADMAIDTAAGGQM